MNSKYMLLQNGPCRVPLKGGKKDYVLTIPQFQFHIAPSSERLMVYWLYQTHNKGKFAEYLRSYSKIELTAKNIDDAVRQFQTDHEPTPASYYMYEEIPLMADPERGLDLPIPGYVCNISMEHESELLQMIIAEPYSITFSRIRHWFWRYCSDYGLDYNKKCKGEQYNYLAESFMEQHGISHLPDKPASPPKYKKKRCPLAFFAGPVVIMLWGGVGISLFLWSNRIMDGDYPLLGVLIAVIALLILGAPFISIKNK